MSAQIAELESALGPMRDALLADGYRLDVTEADAQLSLKVVALGNACPDCLVPAQAMAMMVSAKLAGSYAPEDIVITYPEG
jgi:hypothetical protein